MAGQTGLNTRLMSQVVRNPWWPSTLSTRTTKGASQLESVCLWYRYRAVTRPSVEAARSLAREGRLALRIAGANIRLGAPGA